MSRVKSSPPPACVTSELLEQHLKAYHELMQVQPRRHTEQQIAEDRRRARETARVKQSIELDQLRQASSLEATSVEASSLEATSVEASSVEASSVDVSADFITF